MVSPVLLAAPFSILPAVGAIWYLLKRYEDYFEDARVFLSLVFGFFMGLVAITMELTVFPFHDVRFIESMGPGTAFIFFVGGYALFETGAKVAVLGMRRFRSKKDAPFYGAPLGLGMGAMMALGFIAVNLNRAEAAGIPHGISSFLGMASVPLGAVFVHGAAGVYVGQGSGDGKLWRGWIIGTLLQMPVLGTYWLVWDLVGRGDAGLQFYVIPAIIALGYGMFLLHISRVRVLDNIVPQEIRDQVRRERRRALRQGAGAAAGAAAVAGAGGAAAIASANGKDQDDSEE